jgi:phage shock protein E
MNGLVRPPDHVDGIADGHDRRLAQEPTTPRRPTGPTDHDTRSIRMNHRSTRFGLVVLLALAAIAIAACGGSSARSAIQKVDPSEAVRMLDSRVVIDVRTHAEYAAGHIAGAQNISVEAADFASRISSLDQSAAYLVYCHSGRRSAVAADQMVAAGFSDIVDAGGMADLAAAGAPLE